jgi:hypothetical protein
MQINFTKKTIFYSITIFLALTQTTNMVECMETKEDVKEQASQPTINQSPEDVLVKEIVKPIYIAYYAGFYSFILCKWIMPSITNIYFSNNIDYCYSALKEKPLLFPLNKLSSSDLPKDTVNIIQDTAKIMNIPSDTLIELNSNFTMGAGMFFDKLLKINPNIINKTPLEQLRFVIGHEFGHKLYSHNLKFDIAEITVPVLTLLGLKVCDHLTTKLIKKLKALTQIKETDLSYKALNILETLNRLFYNFPLTHYILTEYILSKISQDQEKRADLISVRMLNCTQGALDFLSNKKLIHIQDFFLQYPLLVTKYMIDQLFSGDFKGLIEVISLFLEFNTHPSYEERIAYIQQFNNQKT